MIDRLKKQIPYIEGREHGTPMLVHSTLAQPIVHNEWAGMCFENVLNVVRGVRCVCCVCCALCRGVFRGSFSSTVLSRFNRDSEESAQCPVREKPVLTYEREAGSFLSVVELRRAKEREGQMKARTTKSHTCFLVFVRFSSYSRLSASFSFFVVLVIFYTLYMQV